jgi:hypothetical protein
MAVLLHGLVPKQTLRRAGTPAHDRIACSAFDALASPAPPDLDDLPPDKLADLALHHNAVLLAYCHDGPVLPLRFGTAFSSAAAATEHLHNAADAHLRALLITGTFREYTIRLSLRADPPEPARIEPQSGRDFLSRGLQVRDHRRTISDRRTALARQLLSGLRETSWQIRAAGAPKPDRLLDATLLLPPANLPALMALSRCAGPEAANLGLDLHLSGPWPAYSFDPGNPPVPDLCHGA